jgi:hypothetical protein
MIPTLTVLVFIFALIALGFYLAFRHKKQELKYANSLVSEQRKQLGNVHEVLEDFPTDATTPYSTRVQMIVSDLANYKLEARQIDWHLNVVALDKQVTRIDKIKYLIRMNQEAARAGFISNRDADYR